MQIGCREGGVWNCVVFSLRGVQHHRRSGEYNKVSVIHHDQCWRWRHSRGAYMLLAWRHQALIRAAIRRKAIRANIRAAA
jgi:hypothetical protein